MIEIEINPTNTRDIFTQISEYLDGTVEESWGEYTMTIDNANARGTITYIPFDWGVNLLDFDIKFYKEFVLKIEAEDFNPIRFIYNLQGAFEHRLGAQNEERKTQQFQSVIFANKSDGTNYLHFPKNEKLQINIIQIVRKEFLKKRTTNVSSLNKKLYEVFVDTDHENRFVHYGELNLKMADDVKSIHKIKSKGMLRVLKIEAKIYEILSLHIQQHNRQTSGKKLPKSITKQELKTVKKICDLIQKEPAKQYSLDQLSIDYGLSQAKLQDGFKFLYKRTVTEFIRHIRLEQARELMKMTDLNISQIVYSIGFTSRSYFSKIFKEKYGISPNEFKKQIVAKVKV
ncbi:helix-turn-helix domain-containing protein [Winogradskyella bathintestinalis]|uniref:AraC family transcriptional regulator n=1 Tax=Winogradskyella bathintestinalis TaxID=3035208 RepID=A0ABT7ZTK5_9FLAO|nr:AraC family transcriptional regulator [Winogradskyella bathintestinalis]MDN3492350.1 AraC family transcriptional regulator [Winogradskyella bathintestinalis]